MYFTLFGAPPAEAVCDVSLDWFWPGLAGRFYGALDGRELAPVVAVDCDCGPKPLDVLLLILRAACPPPTEDIPILCPLIILQRFQH